MSIQKEHFLEIVYLLFKMLKITLNSEYISNKNIKDVLIQDQPTLRFINLT